MRGHARGARGDRARPGKILFCFRFSVFFLPFLCFGFSNDVLDLQAAARVIATAAGPSGPNCEYLFQLAEALGDSDDTLRDLCARVRAVLTN